MSTEQRLPDHTRAPERPADPPPPSSPDKPRGLDLSVSKIGGGALAAMTAAIVGSHLSVAGTVIGAAVASVVAAVAGSVYTASLARTRDTVRQVIGGRAVDRRAIDEPRPAAPAVAASAAVPRPARASRLNVKSIVIGALLVFGVAALALTGIELVTGSALSGGKGTTISQVSDGEAVPPVKPSKASTAKSTPEPSGTPTAPATATATDARPSSAATPTTSRPTTEPTKATSPQPSASATDPATTAPSSTAEPTAGAPGGTAAGSSAPSTAVTPLG